MKQICRSLIMQFKKIEHIGISPSPISSLGIRVRLVNVLALFSFFTAINYIVVSVASAPAWMIITGLIYVLAVLTVFYLNHKRRHGNATTLLCITSAIAQSVLILRYGAEAVYHFVGFLIAITFLYRNIWIHILCAFSLIIVIAIARQGTILEAEVKHDTDTIYWFNICTIILYVFILMRYFLKLQDMYRLEIEHQKSEIEALNKQHGEIFTIVAHDIRSPLTASKQYIELLSHDENINDYARQMLGPVRSTLNTLSKNTENLIHWSKQNREGQTHIPDSVKLAPIISEIINSMQIDLTEKNLQIEMDVSDMINVYADRDHTRIILYNILQNALKFSHPGKKVRISALEKTNAVAITVRDYGVGMSPERLLTLFNKPHIPAFGTVGERGSGIGLVLIKSLVELNKGRIQAHSQENVGSTFTLHLPIASSHIQNNTWSQN